ncbi:MAG: hypothetical protein IT515_15990 [Burkholderiales bacterium]|nr:hypothetical protein [Burkholderiales bacterium]
MKRSICPVARPLASGYGRLAILLLLSPLAVLAGCATDLTRRDATGNPQVARMSQEDLARSTPNPPAVPDTEDIVRMSRSGVPPAQIIERIKAGGGRYPLTPEQIDGLRARGVDQAVLDHLVAAEHAAQQADRADREARAERELARQYGYPTPDYRDYYRQDYPWGFSPYLGYGFWPHASGWYGGVRVW